MLNKKLLILLLVTSCSGFSIAGDDDKNIKRSAFYAAIALSTATLTKRSMQHAKDEIGKSSCGFVEKSAHVGFTLFAIGSAIYYASLASKYIHGYIKQEFEKYKNKAKQPPMVTDATT